MIESESKTIWKILLKILILPFTLIMVLLKRKTAGELLSPLKEFVGFFFEAKFTLVIILLNIGLYFASLFFSESLFNSLINYPADLLSLRIYSFFTAGFLHADLSHLFGNMVGILIFGRVVERKFGAVKTAIIYFGALFLSSFFSSAISLFVLNDNTGGLGASGALMGLVATAILLQPFYLTYMMLIPLPIMVVGWLFIYADIVGIINPTADGIGHFAHLGGFISIAVIMFLLNLEERSELKKGFLINIISLVIGALIYFFVAS